MERDMHRSLFALTTVAIAAATALPASARDPGTIRREVVVSYGDLKLGTPDGDRQLAMRIAQAAHMACGGNPRFETNYGIASRFVLRDHARCTAAAAAKAQMHLARSVAD